MPHNRAGTTRAKAGGGKPVRLPLLRQHVARVKNVELDVPAWMRADAEQKIGQARRLQMTRLQNQLLPQNLEQHPKKTTQVDRIMRLRQAKMRRSRMLDKEALESQRLAAIDDIIQQGRRRASEAIPRSARSSSTTPPEADKAIVLAKGPSIHASTYRNVSEVQDYLNAFRSSDDGDAADAAHTERPPSFLFQESGLFGNDDSTRDVSPTALDDEVADGIDGGEGIFGLTQAIGSPSVQPVGLVGSDQSDPPATASDSASDLRVESWNLNEALMAAASSAGDVSKAPAYSHQGKSYRKFRRLEMERAHQKSGEKATKGGPAAARVPRIGRTPHLPKSVELVSLEVDILKEISVREELVTTCRKSFVRLVETVETVRDLRLELDRLRSARSVPGAASVAGDTGAKRPGSGTPGAGVAVDPVLRKRQVIATLSAQRRRLDEMQTELRGELVRLREVSAKVGRAIHHWRSVVCDLERRLQLDASFPIFDWLGENYLVRMQSDVGFLEGKSDPRINSDERAGDKGLGHQGRPITSRTKKTLRNTLASFAALEDFPARQRQRHQQEQQQQQQPNAGFTPLANFAFETPAYALVGRWIGFSTANNPLLLPPKDHDPYAQLERWTKLEDERQVAQRQADMRKQILLGLQAGKTASQIFEDALGKAKSAVVLPTGGLMTSFRVGHRLTVAIHRSPSELSYGDAGPASLSARGFHDLDRPRFAGLGRCPVSPRFTEDEVSDDHEDGDDDETGPALAVAANDGDGAVAGTKKAGTLARLPKSHSQRQAQAPHEFPEMRGRAFDLGLAPRPTPLVPGVGDEVRAGEIAATAAEIVRETAAIEEWKLEKARELQRSLQAYDPVANTEARGGRDRALDTFLAKQVEPEDRESLRQRAEHVQDKASPRPNGLAVAKTDVEEIAAAGASAGLGKLEDVAQQDVLRAPGMTRVIEVRRVASRIDASAFTACRNERMRVERELARLAALGSKLTSTQLQTRKELELRLSILLSGASSSLSDGELLAENEAEMHARKQAHARVERAATRVQSMARMHKDRKSFLMLLDDEKYLEKLTKEQMMERSVEEVAAMTIQVRFREFVRHKVRQLREATRLMAEEAERKAREAADQEERKRVELEEMRERGRRRRFELKLERDAVAKQKALEAASRAQAARTISRNIRLHVDHRRQKQLALRKLQETREDKAAILVQAHTRGMLVRIHAAALHARERQRRRDIQARRQAREEYAQLYTRPSSPPM